MRAIILAAGFSSRMGEFKPLMKIPEYQNRKVLEIIIEAIHSAGIEDIWVVVGHNEEKIINEIKDVNFLFNENYGKGMFSSIKKGLADANDDVLLFPVDSPFIKSETISTFISEISNEDFATPTFLGVNGHPLFIPKRYLNKILAYNGENGMHGFFEEEKPEIKRIAVSDEGVAFDIDNKKDLEYIKFLNREVISKIKGRLFLARHGKQKWSGEKILLGQTDIPLDEEFFQKPKWIKDIDIKYIASSSLQRAKKTKELLGFEAKDIGEFSEFNEINLGAFDGMSISKIKEKYSKEYKERGENILNYRPKGGENFYDLRYRAYRGLKSLAEKCGEDGNILLVTHNGVIKTLISLFENMPLEEAIKKKIDFLDLISL
jgi:CTP:molybdopterin cytidylyltransferase MocA/broad specificity phosphatase PhoE